MNEPESETDHETDADDLPLDDARTFFEGPVHELWHRIVPPEMTAAEVDFLAGVFDSGKARPRLLDLASGAGRHALGLAAHGFAVTAVDVAASELALLAKVAAAMKLEVRTVQHDLRGLASWEVPKPFDGAYCFGNALAYFAPGELADLLAAVAARLRPGAALVLDSAMVAESFLAHFQARIDLQAGDLHLALDNDYDVVSSRVIGSYTFTDGLGVVTTRRFAHWCLTTRELIELVADAGFEVEALLDGVEGEAYALGSPRLVLVARRA